MDQPEHTTMIAPTFSWYDYLIFSGMLTVSVIIGIYFGCFGSKQSTANEYLMGSKKMHVFPIAMSLVASHISGVTLLGVPADVYKFGAAYWLCVFALIIVSFVTIFVYLPVLYQAQITSVYEYLEKRFDQKTRVFSSFLFAVSQILFLPVVIYIPALAFAAATGINLHLVTPVICAVCIFYTTIGGLKAVVWTDTLQFTVTLGAVTTVLVLGIKATGGFSNVWQKAVDGKRLDFFDFEFDVTRSDNFWAAFIGLTFLWISQTNTSQSCVQKLLSVPTLKDAKFATIYYGIGMILVKTASVLIGLVIYARYSICDPFETHKIIRKDQLLPFYVLDVAGKVPGLSGLFIAGVFSAGLSTLSAHLNCLSGTIYEDFVSKLIPKDITERTKSNILKLIVVICGAICTLLVFLFERLGGILPLVISFQGLTGGPLLGMFTLGILSRRANSKGAFYGGIFGITGLACLVIPAKYLQSQGMMHIPAKPISTDGCNFNFTKIYSNQTIENDGLLKLFKISYYYYTLLGFFFTMIFGLIVSYCTKEDERTLHENLLSPVIQRKGVRNENNYNTVENALNLVTYNSDKL
ncbi:sodium-coupled monocarboxylate transporter 2-like [Tribolium madens]|uniref:sodium-coupled monocarboxylate transporter 2-like n=1 Tax=Tribolium madens TaxID=41895 RepID=UPI001CF75E5D|nr:sodium-coupled monocarboxylate transporter 2-like [Tribolium madens]